jgi:hypothetical protein
MTSRRRCAAALVARALWAGLALLPACASSQEWVYEKPKNTPAALDHDKAVCRKIAPSRSMLRLLEDDKVEREGFNRCMRARGYTVTVAPR